MAIIRYTKDATIRYAYLNIFPDQFKTEKEKLDESWVKNTMDYFANKAYAEYIKNRDTFVKNYDLVKGILRMEDFYQEPEVKSFADMLTADLELPAYVKHYSIITTPLNELIGEMSKRPDSIKIKAFDEDSRNEEIEFRTEVLNKMVIAKAKSMLMEKAASEGVEMSEEELEQAAIEDVKDVLDSYTSIAEKWGNHTLTALQVEFNIKEKKEDAFRDLGISARQFYHIYEDNSKTGFNIEVANPKNTWFLTTPDRKYISDVTGRAQGAYAAGIVMVMELSEIIERFPDLTKDEIDHLRSSLQDYGLINVRESNLGNPNATPGIDSVQYDTYDPLVLQTRMIIESEMKENNDGLKDFLGLTSNVSSFGYKYVVVQGYWLSKKKIGKLVYLDEVGNTQSTLVDENYKSGTIPTQISLEWGWINEWWQGVKIGPDIYHVKPLKLLPYLPIIGLVHEVKNTEAKSIVDLMKPFQVIYNICMNQLYRLLEKEIGNVANINIRRVPKLKDGDDQDALDVWEMEARERGIVFDDDSPENTKAPVSNTSVAKNIDLTRTNEIQSRYTLAQQMKNECWELIGMSKQRLGSISASESATGTNAAIQQSYSQTEPLFVAHEYTLLQLYQAMLDAALYIESKKPLSTLSYINDEGETAFIQLNGTDLKLRDLRVFPTNRPEDTQMFNEIRQLAQAVIQNGGSLYEVIELYSTKSLRQMKKVFKDLRDRMNAMQENEQKLKQQQIEQQQQQAEAQMQQEERHHQDLLAMEKYKTDVKATTDLAKAEIQTYFSAPEKDVDNSGTPDIMEITSHQEKVRESLAKSDLENKKLSFEMQKMLNDNKQKEEDRKIVRENMKNDEKIAKLNLRNRKSASKK